MSLEKRRIGSMLLLLLGAVITLSALTLRAQQQRSPSPKAEQPSDNPYPVVSLADANSTQHEKDSKRREKGKRYNNGGVVKNGSGLQQSTLFTDWSFSVTELPSKISDVIIIGTVLDAQAYLSPDATGVYSEFTIRVDEILKDSMVSTCVGNSVAVERTGGRVRYPSGEDVTYYIEGQGVPRVNRRYVFFLKREEANLSIITGYELHEKKVRPLDHSVKFKKFEGVSEESLLNQIRSVIASGTINTSGVEK